MNSRPDMWHWFLRAIASLWSLRTIARLLIKIGGVVGAFGAILTLLVWLWGKWVDPNVSVTIDSISIRCAYQLESADEELNWEKHCAPAPVSMSTSIEFKNRDSVKRNVSDLEAEIELKSRSFMYTVYMPWVLDVSHERVNGKETVTWSEWESLVLNPDSSVKHEFLFRPKYGDSEYNSHFMEGLLKKDMRGVSATIRVRFAEKADFVEIIRCEGEFISRAVDVRIEDVGKRNQITVECK